MENKINRKINRNRKWTEKVGDDNGGESRQRESKGTYECCAA